MIGLKGTTIFKFNFNELKFNIDPTWKRKTFFWQISTSLNKISFNKSGDQHRLMLAFDLIMEDKIGYDSTLTLSF
jgi:hypothetical protein